MRGSASFQAVLLQTAIHCAATQAESFGGLADVAVVARERALNQVMLYFVQTHFFEPRAGTRRRRTQSQIRGAHQRPGGKQHAAFDRVVQLADIPRPQMLVQYLSRDRIEAADGFTIALCVAAQEMVRK